MQFFYSLFLYVIIKFILYIMIMSNLLTNVHDNLRNLVHHKSLVSKDQFGKHWLWNNKTNQFHAIQTDQLVNIAKIIGPLVVQYIVPFVKDLISGLKKSNSEPTPAPAPALAPVHAFVPSNTLNINNWNFNQNILDVSDVYWAPVSAYAFAPVSAYTFAPVSAYAFAPVSDYTFAPVSAHVFDSVAAWSNEQVASDQSGPKNYITV
jgi:hypothetical protein